MRPPLSIRAAGTLLGAALLCGAAADPAFEHADGAYVGYGFSGFLDGCGRGALGEAFRKAILERVEACPFTAEARKELRAKIAREVQPLIERFRRHSAEHGGAPDRLPDGTPCGKVLSDQRMVQLQSRFEQLQRGEIRPGQLLEGSCKEIGAFQ